MVRMLPVPVTALPRVQDRMSFLYLEHCVVHREDGALTARNDQGTIRVPAASLISVFLGPGTSVSHQAMSLLGECGTTAVWVGERGVRYYAHGRSLATSTRLLVEQAARVSSPQKRLRCARDVLHALQRRRCRWAHHAAAQRPGRHSGPRGVPRELKAHWGSLDPTRLSS